MTYRTERDFNFCFVGGPGRSGTTLMMALLHSHPDVVALPESGIIHQIMTKPFRQGGDLIGSLRDSGTLAKIDGAGADIDLQQLCATTIENNSNIISFYRRLADTVAAESKASIVVDKWPRYLEICRLLRRLFEGSRFVCLNRDPRDILASRQQTAWCSDDSLLRHLGVISLHSCYSDFIGQHYSDFVIPVQYSDIVLHTDDTLEYIYNEIGLQYYCNSANHRDAARELIRPDELEWKQRSLQRIDSKSIGRWQSDLTEFEAHAASVAGCWTPAVSAERCVSRKGKTIHPIRKAAAHVIGNIVRASVPIVRYIMERFVDLLSVMVNRPLILSNNSGS